MPKKAKTVKKAVQSPKPVATVQSVGGGLHWGKLLLGLGILVVIGIVALFLTGGASSSTQFPAFAHSNAATPQVFSVIGNSSGSVATQSLASLAQNSIASTDQLTILYAGSITAHYSVISISSPILISDYKICRQ